MSLRALYDLQAPAKLNLFLHVVGRREDGYHLLESVFVLIDWADTLHFELRRDGRIARHDLGPALPANDLCLRASTLLQRESGSELGVDISIDKQLPWGAGMGGGSSDAATTLLALNRLWGLNMSRSVLAQLGLQLGADVPFFVAGQNAFVQGIGERLTPLAIPDCRFVVVKPPQNIATPDIFGHPELVRDTAPLQAADILAGFSEGRGSVWKNDLQPPAEARCPQVAQAARWLQSRYGNSRMTGSGSAVFARVSDEAAFDASELPTQWVGRRVRSLPVHPLAGWAN